GSPTSVVSNDGVFRWRIVKNGTCPSWPNEYTGTMFGCSSSAVMRASTVSRAAASADAAAGILRATTRFSPSSWMGSTTPSPPAAAGLYTGICAVPPDNDCDAPNDDDDDDDDAKRRTRSGRSVTTTTSPVEMAAARSIAFFSSRTLPGHGYAVMRSTTSCDNV